MNYVIKIWFGNLSMVDLSIFDFGDFLGNDVYWIIDWKDGLK